MTVLDGILLSLGADTSKLADASNPYGRGHILNLGRVFQCAGLMGPNPRYDEDSAAGLNPDAEVLVQHVIGTITAVPQGWLGVATEDTQHCTFTLEQNQYLINPENPVCQVCGQPPIN